VSVARRGAPPGRFRSRLQPAPKAHDTVRRGDHRSPLLPPMRTTKAYLAGLGTTGALIAMTVLLLVLGSGLVGFDGAPSLNGDEGRLYPSADGSRTPAARDAQHERADRRRRARIESAARQPEPVARGTLSVQLTQRTATTGPNRPRDRRVTPLHRRPTGRFGRLGGGVGFETGGGGGTGGGSGGENGGGENGGVERGAGSVGGGTPTGGAEGGRGADRGRTAVGGGTPVRGAGGGEPPGGGWPSRGGSRVPHGGGGAPAVGTD
jgi:hypothetical protein